jgi:bile acid-coenzyme A ligase
MQDQEVLSCANTLRQRLAESPDERVYWHVGRDGHEQGFSWREIDQRSSQIAAGLLQRGARFGDRVSIGLQNSPAFTLSVLAVWKIGAIPIPVRWDLPDWELGRVREVIDPVVHLGEDDLGWIADSANDPVAQLPDVVSPQRHGICSSGSTGTPKVILSDAPALFDPIMATPMGALWGPVSSPQVILVLAPMYHVNAFTTLTNMMAGDRLVVLEKFDAALALSLIESHKITNFTATPTMLQRMADRPEADDRDLSSLEFFIQGAAPMPPTLVHRWAGLIGADKIIMAYGMTEALGLTALRGDEWMEHQGSVGKGFGDTEIKILDSDGKELPAGEIGDIYMRNGTYGDYDYLGDAPRLPSTPDGFVTAGDVGYLDEEGYLFLSDRRVDLIITGGANVFPAEVEMALIDNPGIADVVVIGLRDPEWGRRVHAIIEPSDLAKPPTLDDVVTYAKSRLAPYKVPKTIEIVAEVPRSAATKVSRGRLVDERGG